jgi:hypothetical protein
MGMIIIAAPPMRASASCVLLAVLLAGARAGAQTLPEGPFRSPDGTLVVSGEVAGTIGGADSSAFFNYTDYEHNALRLFRASVAGAWRPLSRLALVGELRSEDLDQVAAYGAYVRARPFRSVPLDVQAGLIPPSFGAFGRRAYNVENPLIGYPLAYQYLTSLRPDAIPANTDDLLIMRGRGWRSSFPVGSPVPGPGVPLVTAFRWDTGVQARWSVERIEVAGGVTVGTLSDPQGSDNNGGRQLSGRIAVRPIVGLVLGASAARGEWLSSDVGRLLPPAMPSDGYAQTAFGADAEYSWSHWLLRGELVWSRWDMPLAGTAVEQPLSAWAGWVEARYRITPRVFAAARADHLGFSRIAGTLFDGRPVTWDAPVDRVEAGGGYYLQRNLIARAIVQHNRRDGGRITARTYVSAQLAYWF